MYTYFVHEVYESAIYYLIYRAVYQRTLCEANFRGSSIVPIPIFMKRCREQSLVISTGLAYIYVYIYKYGENWASFSFAPFEETDLVFAGILEYPLRDT